MSDCYFSALKSFVLGELNQGIMCFGTLNLKSRTNQVSTSLLRHSRLSGPVLKEY